MSIADLYQIAGTPKTWEVPQEFLTCFHWEFTPERSRLLNLYERGKTM